MIERLSIQYTWNGSMQENVGLSGKYDTFSVPPALGVALSADDEAPVVLLLLPPPHAARANRRRVRLRRRR